MNAKKAHIDRSETFDEFLAKDGLLGETEDAALKDIIADQIKVAMKSKGLGRGSRRSRTNTSRRQLDRLLDPNNPSVNARDATTGRERGGAEFKGGVEVRT